MSDKLNNERESVLAGILLKYHDSISIKAVAEIREVLWGEIDALEEKLAVFENDERARIVTDVEGLAGVDDLILMFLDCREKQAEFENGETRRRRHLAYLERRSARLRELLNTIDPGALRMAADELPDTAEPRAAHLRRIAALAEEGDLSKLTTQQKPTEEAMEDA